MPNNYEFSLSGMIPPDVVFLHFLFNICHKEDFLLQELKDLIHDGDYKSETESWLSVNLIMQFLFKEWEDTAVIRQ